MILYDLFSNNLEILILEFFFTILILTLLLFCTFIITKKKNIQKNLKITLTFIISYLIFISFFYLFEIPYLNTTLLNSVLFFDYFSKIIKLIIIILTFIYLLIQKTYTKSLKFENIILILISILGLFLLISSYNFIILYLSIELQSLCFYILASSNNKSPFSSEAALKYFILGAIASGFILFGSSIIYLTTGSLNFGVIKCIIYSLNKINNLEIILSIFYGLLFIFIGLLFKIGSVPFHTWVPDVYEGSPTNITAFFAIMPKIAILSLIIRFFFDIFFDISEFFESIFYICSLLSIFIGAFATLKQKKIKRLLAYSSIGHTGFLLIGFSSNLTINLKNILFYIIIYLIMTINFWTIFLSFKINKNNLIKYLTDFVNFSKLNIVLSFIIILNLFSMAGIPPLAGFFSKFFIFYSALIAKNFSLVLLGVLISVISVFYYIRIIKIIFFDNSINYKILNKIPKVNSIILLINSQILIIYFLYPNYLLIFLEEISLLYIL